MGHEHKDWVDEANAAFDEVKRVERWHATFNAALTGLLAYPGHAAHSAPLTVTEAVEAASQAASKMHGDIVK